MGKIAEVTEKVYLWLLEQPIGTEVSLREAYENVYKADGYEWVQYPKKGWVSSKDGGNTYLIEDADLFEILGCVRKKLKEEKRTLDFSKWYNMCVGVPYNLPFVIKEALPFQFPRECNVRFVELNGVRIGSGSYKKYDEETAYMKYMYVEPSDGYDEYEVYQELYEVLEKDIIDDKYQRILVMTDETSDVEIFEDNDFEEVEDVFDRELIIRLDGAQVDYKKAYIKKLL